MKKIQIYFVNGDSKEEIDDLYWFEENCVHWFDFTSKSFFEIYVDGVLVLGKE